MSTNGTANDATSVSSVPTTQLPITSSAAPSSSSLPPSTSVPTTSAAAPVSTSTPPTTTTSIPSTTTPTTSSSTSAPVVFTTVSSSSSNNGGSAVVVTRTVTSTSANASSDPTQGTSSALPLSSGSPTSSAISSATAAASSGGGLNGTSKVVVAVIVPIAGVALLAIGLLLWWKRRQKNKAMMEERRKEVEEYGYNANGSPALGTGGDRSSAGEDASYDMMETGEGAGYRGWGSTNGGRKSSTNFGSSSVGTAPQLSPTVAAYTGEAVGVAHSPTALTDPASEGHASNTPLVGNGNGSHEGSPNANIYTAMGAPATSDNSGGVHRGISNASSNYSAMTTSHESDSGPDGQYYGADAGYEDGYNYSGNPYQQYPEGGQYQSAPPVIRDVSARRSAQVETPSRSHFPQQGNSGLATNF